MRAQWIGFAAAIAVCGLAVPAAAGTPEEPFVGVPGANANPPAFGGTGFQLGGPGSFGDSRFDRRFDRRRGDGSLGVWVNGGEWARYNNPAWQSSGFNDWWHDRPDRAYPAWMRNNQDCAKHWYAGSALRC
jgi:hypothetical protein